MSNVTAITSDSAIAALKAAVDDHIALTYFHPTLRRRLIAEKPLAEAVAKKMNPVLRVQSISAFVQFYKKIHREYEDKPHHSEMELVVDNPTPFRIGKLNIGIGGKEYPAYKKRITPISLLRTELNRVRFSMFSQYAAITGLIDACIQIDPNAFFDDAVFSYHLRDPKNFKIAVRASRAFYYTEFAEFRMKSFSARDQSDILRMLDAVEQDRDRLRLKHYRIRRSLLFMRMREPEIFSSRLLKSKDYIRVFDALKVRKIPSQEQVNQILGEFLREPEVLPRTPTLGELFNKSAIEPGLIEVLGLDKYNHFVRPALPPGDFSSPLGAGENSEMVERLTTSDSYPDSYAETGVSPSSSSESKKSDSNSRQ